VFTIPGIGVHDRPEWAFTIVRNMQQDHFALEWQPLQYELVEE